MDFRKQRLSVAEAKEIDLVEYLSQLGHQAVKIRGGNHWYLSPLRKEKSPSFTVNQSRNVWYDFGIGQGGSIIDFGVAYHKVSIPDLLQLLTDGNFVPVTNADVSQKESKDSKIRIVSESGLTSPSLLRYLNQRGVSENISNRYCSEVRFETNGKTYFGIGFKNDSGGYEIRNPYFKGSSSPKDVTSIKDGHGSVAVFEGFFDFLSCQTLHESSQEPRENDYLILNSLSFFEKSLSILESYSDVHLYLDNNAAGQKCTELALSLSGRFKDERRLYKGFEDLNDFLLASSNRVEKVKKKGIRY